MDYSAIGFKCGIEIHQQIEGKKLFCNCPTLNSDLEPDIKVVRKLRAVAGETGEIDIAAKHEMQKAKTILYLSSSVDSCLVELDEEPPHPINQEALRTAIEVALLLNAHIVDEIQVMRKTVVDGSNTSGFQRTALIAQDGFIDTALGNVNIPTICLEEEAAQKVSEDQKTVTYRLDRLGIPLIEIATSADIKTPEHAKEVAEKLGMVLRSTGKVKRGIGTIRQDVNISVKGGARTEIKGFQELKSIPKVIEFEIDRQLKLIKQGKKISNEVRKAEPDGTTIFLRPMPGAARMYPETDIMPVRATTEGIELSELIESKSKKFESLGLSKDLASSIAKSNKASLFESYIKTFKNIKPAFIAETLVSAPKELRRRNNIDIEPFAKDKLDELFLLIDNGTLPKESVLDAMLAMAKGTFRVSDYKTVSSQEIEEFIINTVKEKPGLNFGALMGLVMAQYRGKADGKLISELVKKHAK
ncbi:MAG: Glu-tRNA(Gln) amidotransferase subunit GatE [Candidatus Woesearchaeota archaeon]